MLGESAPQPPTTWNWHTVGTVLISAVFLFPVTSPSSAATLPVQPLGKTLPSLGLLCLMGKWDEASRGASSRAGILRIEKDRRLFGCWDRPPMPFRLKFLPHRVAWDILLCLQAWGANWKQGQGAKGENLQKAGVAPLCVFAFGFHPCRRVISGPAAARPL